MESADPADLKYHEGIMPGKQARTETETCEIDMSKLEKKSKSAMHRPHNAQCKAVT